MVDPLLDVINSSDNATLWPFLGKKRWQNPQWAKFVEALVLTAIMFSAIIGNSLVVAVVYRRKELRNVTSIFIVNLSISDIAVAVLCMPFSIVTAFTDKWIFGKEFCKVNGFLNVFFLLNSILTLTAISIQKYFAIVMPLRESVTTKRAIQAIVWTWCQSLITALTPVMGWNSYIHIPGRMQCSAKVPITASETINCFFIIVTGFVIPLGVMHFAYFSIFINVRKHTRRLRKHVVSDQALKSEKNVTITLVIILSLFLLCWAPFSVLVTFASVKKSEVLPEYFHIVAYWMGFFSSAVNPIVFALRTKTFRNGYLEIIYSLCGCCCASGKERRELCRAKNCNGTVRSCSEQRGSRRSVAVAWAGSNVSRAPNKSSIHISLNHKPQEATPDIVQSRPDILSAIDERDDQENGVKLGCENITKNRTEVQEQFRDSEKSIHENQSFMQSMDSGQTPNHCVSETKSLSNSKTKADRIAKRAQNKFLVQARHDLKNTDELDVTEGDFSITAAVCQKENENVKIKVTTHADNMMEYQPQVEQTFLHSHNENTLRIQTDQNDPANDKRCANDVAKIKDKKKQVVNSTLQSFDESNYDTENHFSYEQEAEQAGLNANKRSEGYNEVCSVST